MRKYLILILVLVFVLNMCNGCSTKNVQSNTTGSETLTQEKESYKDTDLDTDANSSNIVINTEYIPIDYRENALIVQRSEDIELYGLVDDKGNIVLEPEYDFLGFTSMNGEDFIKATLATECGILYSNGEEYIGMGEYDDIVSAGDIGWLAIKNEKQYLLDEKGIETVEYSNIYKICIGNKYLFKDNSNSSMQDGHGMESCGIGQLSGDIHDLNENLLISAESMNISYYDWLVGGDMFEVLIVRNGKGVPTLIDTKGNIVAELGDDPNNLIVDVMMDEQKIIFRNTLSHNNGLLEYDLSSGLITETIYPNETAWNSQIIVGQVGDFYQLYRDGELLLDERFADYSFNDGVIWLENIDSEWGIVDYNGDIVIPFGEMKSRDSYYQEGNLPFLVSNGMFGFYIFNGGEYEFHNFVVAKGRLIESDTL